MQIVTRQQHCCPDSEIQPSCRDWMLQNTFLVWSVKPRKLTHNLLHQPFAGVFKQHLGYHKFVVPVWTHLTSNICDIVNWNIKTWTNPPVTRSSQSTYWTDQNYVWSPQFARWLLRTTRRCSLSGSLVLRSCHFFGDEAVNWNRVELQGHLCERLAIRGGSTCLHRLKGSTFEKMQLDWLFAMIYIFECLAVVLNMLNDQCHWVGRDPELIHFFSSRFFFPLLFSAQPVAMGQPLDPLRGLSAHLNEVVGVFFFRTMIPPWEYGVIILFFLSCCFDLEHLAQVFQVQDGKEGSNDINCP